MDESEYYQPYLSMYPLEINDEDAIYNHDMKYQFQINQDAVEANHLNDTSVRKEIQPNIQTGLLLIIISLQVPLMK